ASPARRERGPPSLCDSCAGGQGRGRKSGRKKRGEPPRRQEGSRRSAARRQPGKGPLVVLLLFLGALAPWRFLPSLPPEGEASGCPPARELAIMKTVLLIRFRPEAAHARS